MVLLRDPILLGLLAGTFVTAVILTERHLRSRLTGLDAFAERRGLRCQRGAPLQALAPLEPLALLPAVVAVQRLLQTPLPVSAPRNGNPLAPVLGWAEVTLCLCLAGNRRDALKQLLGVFPGSPDLPSLRAGPGAALALAPGQLGFSPMNALGLPAGYQVEAFQPPAQRLTQVLGEHLSAAAPLCAEGLTVELRAGRVLLAVTPLDATGGSANASAAAEQVAALVELGLRLGPALHEALTAPPEGGPVLRVLS